MHFTRASDVVLTVVAALVLLTLPGCGGGGGGTPGDSGPDRTTLSVAASDAEGDALHYQWRVTAGTVEDRDAPTTTWTLPPGPGLHFAYVTVSDRRGGHVQAQYAVSSDALGRDATAAAQAMHSPPAVTSPASVGTRLRFSAAGDWSFSSADGRVTKPRQLYLTDVLVDVRDGAGGTVFSGRSDALGDVTLPPLAPLGTGAYAIRCTRDTALAHDAWPLCANHSPSTSTTSTLDITVAPVGDVRNLRLYGHVELADGTACGRQDPYFGLSSSATVRLRQADGTVLTPSVGVNRYGDYLLEAAVDARGRYQLETRCEALVRVTDLPAPPAAGYLASTPVPMPPQRLGNTAPRLVRMIASGPDGNVRGRLVTPLDGLSNTLPGPDRFLTYKGQDTARSACAYYRALGMVADCDDQGGMVRPVTMDEWQRQHRLPPYDSAIAPADKSSADYINRMDLNLVRRMSAARRSSDSIAFLVCNHPGPDGQQQAEIDHVIDQARQDLRRVACVGMEWTSTPGANSGRPFTKFVTFGPDGALLATVNLDGRGEKYMPGVCVACHGGSRYGGRFPVTAGASPDLGSNFLPFDAGNYLFSSALGLREDDQQQTLKALNLLVRATETPPAGQLSTPVTRLIDGWYHAGTAAQDKGYVPPAWQQQESSAPGAARLYREVVGASCRTCHVAFGTGNANLDWDSRIPYGGSHLCGGGADLARNRSMPNALVTMDRVVEKLRADPELAKVSGDIFGCDITRPAGDPVFDTR